MVDTFLRESCHRRTLLRVGGGLALFDGGLTALAAPRTNLGNRRSCILVYLLGGPSHLDSFDLKPAAPTEVRGPFAAIPTKTPGVQICEHLSRTAQVMNHVALIRSVTHELGNHDTGSHFLLTGHRPTQALTYPSLGSIVARETTKRGAIPPYIAIPEATPSLGPGYLTGAFAPFATGSDPAREAHGYRMLP